MTVNHNREVSITSYPTKKYFENNSQKTCTLNKLCIFAHLLYADYDIKPI